MRILTAALLITGFVSPLAHAVDLKQSKFTQVVNDVQVVSLAEKSQKAAAVDDIFRLPDVVRTGPASRAELVAEDRTITRIGANTVFSFDAANRTIQLERGSLLFNSPKGKGGGTIRTGSAAASVLGTTVLISATTNGGFKVLTLEGSAEVRFLKGPRQQLKAGQMTFVLPGSKPGPVISFRLDQQTANSRLVSGFAEPLPSQGLIKSAVNDQLKQIESGEATDTGLLVGGEATATQVEVIQIFDQTAGSLDPTAGFGSDGVVPRDGGFLTPDGILVKTAGAGPREFANGPASAMLTDASVTAGAIDPSRVFTDQQVILTLPSRPTSDSITQLNPYSGLYARNLTFSSPTVNLAPYNSLPFFDFVASRTLTILNSLSFPGFSPGLYFSAGKQIIMGPGSSITTANEFLLLGSIEKMSFDSVQIRNTVGPLELRSDAAITLNSCALQGDSVFVSSGGLLTVGIAPGGSTTSGGVTGAGGSQVGIQANNDITLRSGNGMLVGGVSLSTFSGTGEINLVNSKGVLTVNNGAFLSSSFIGINSPGGVFVDAGNFSGTRLDVTAGGSSGQVAMVRNLNLATFSLVNIAAHTVDLMNVAFASGSSVNLKSLNGQLAANPNTGAVSQPGFVNFHSGVTYGGQPAQSFVGNGVNLSTLR